MWRGGERDGIQLPSDPQTLGGQWEKRDRLPQQVSGLDETDGFRKIPGKKCHGGPAPILGTFGLCGS